MTAVIAVLDRIQAVRGVIFAAALCMRDACLSALERWWKGQSKVVWRNGMDWSSLGDDFGVALFDKG